jgi:hypothetical protein
MYTKPKPTAVATPATATEQLHNKVVAELTTHYSQLLAVSTMITHRKGCYATVINSRINGVSLEDTLGTNNAKVATEQVLNNISQGFSSISIK